MCGIAGIFDRSKAMAARHLQADVTAMADVQFHRGPDDGGAWCDAASGIALSQRRLSIIDCSPAGHQPMHSACGRYVITYNGEIYNYRDIAADLKLQGHLIEGGSDTAILLAACAAWGVEAALEKCIGMFAFALWDKEVRTCTLARDRLGIKPLYWGQIGEVFVFGSQIKALQAFSGWQGTVNRDALLSYMRHAYVPGPASIFSNVQKLQPGHIVIIPATGAARNICYWNLRKYAHAGVATPFTDTYEDALGRMETLLRDAVKRRMVSDVPLGSFLSGGVDSSLVTALMQDQSNTPVRSFSIGFNEPGYDESHHAAKVAAHLGTDHTELTVTSDQVRDLIPNIPQWYDEPFADSSQLPTLMLSQLTRQHVTVALSGDGGDEVFAGYNRYVWAKRLPHMTGCAPRGVRRAIACLMQSVPPGIMNGVGNVFSGRNVPGQLGDKLHKLASVLDVDDADMLYHRLISQWQNPDDIVSGARELESILSDDTVRNDRPDDTGRMQLFDMATYLPDDILTKVDRASMAFSLEARVPLLDHRVVEFAWTLPRDYLLHNKVGKRILRDILCRHVPRSLIERPKMGFGVPLDAWLRGPLRDWAEALLSETRLKNDGYLNPAPVRAAWRRHLAGTRNEAYALWTVLMFQTWLDHNRAIL